MTRQNTIYVNPKTIDRKWYIIDAKDKVLGKVAVEVAKLLCGKHKPCYTPHQEVGDFVVVINADKVKLTGRKPEDKMYYRHSGYPGSLKQESYNTVKKRKPLFPLQYAIKRMLPKNKIGNKVLHNAKLYTGTEHPHVAQKPITYNVKD